MDGIKLIWRNRHVLLQTTLSDLRSRYAGSVLGMAWLLLYPILFLGVYALIYIFVFKIRFQLFNSNEYVVLIFCGLIPFLSISEALSIGVSSVTGNSTLIKNTLFPIELVPVKAVLLSQPIQLIGTIYLFMALAIIQKLSLWSLMFPLIWIFQLLFSIGIIWILSSLNVYMRDLQNIIGVLILILMMISPIAYSADMIPDNLRGFLSLNPLYYFIIAYQDCLMLQRFPAESIAVPLIGMSVFVFILGYWFFTRIKNAMVDNV